MATATINSIPTPPLVEGGAACQPSTFLLEVGILPTDPTYTYKWYSDPSSQTPIGTEASYQTPLISLPATSYYVSRSLGTCESNRAEVEVFIHPPSEIVATGENVPRYGPGAVTLSANNGPYGYRWYDALEGGNDLGSGPSLSPSITETTSYFVTALSDKGCKGPRTEIQAVFIDPANIELQVQGGETIPEGGSSLLSVTGQHDAYQWIRNGIDIPGATNPTYEVTLGGEYKVRLTPGGNTTGSYTTSGKTFAAENSHIIGPNVSFDDNEEKYRFAGDNFVFMDDPSWTVTNGVVSESHVSADGHTAFVTIRWTDPGTGMISLSYLSNYLDTKSVTVTANCIGTSVPSLPDGQKHHFVPTGGSTTVALTTESGTVIQWLDTDMIYETVFEEGTSLAFSNMTYSRSLKVRSYNPTTHCASHMVQVQVNVFDPVAPQNVKQEIVKINDIVSNDQLAALTADEKTTSLSYLDGLARHIQQVIREGSPQGKDFVQPMEFDANGRVAKSYLPYVASTTTGAFQSNFETDQTNFYNNSTDNVADDVSAFAQNKFEQSPIGRIIEQGGMGASFQPGTGHTKEIDYTFNDGSEVRKFNSDGTSSEFYAANALNKSVLSDEDHNESITFTDYRGRTLLKKQQVDETIDGVNVPYLETYYIYDDFDRLKYIISPKGVAKMKGAGWSFTTAVQQAYTYQFLYDHRGRLVEKKVPGQDWVHFGYDDLNRLVLMQDHLLRAENKWIFIKYDQKNRTVMQGLYKNTTDTTRTAIQSMLDGLYSTGNAAFPEANRYEERGAALEGYTSRSFPITNADSSPLELWAVAYYDNHDFNFDGIEDYAYTPQGLNNEVSPSVSTGLFTGSKHIVLGTTTWLSNYVFYDGYRRPIQMRSNNHKNLGLDNVITTVYDDEGKTLITKNYHKAGTSNTTTVVNKFDYDDQGRLLRVYQNNNSAQTDQLVIQYEYNELGQIVDKKLHGITSTEFLQSVDLRYNIQGWLESINNAHLDSDPDNNVDTDAGLPDYFAMELMYHAQDNGLGNTPRFNGSISAMKWKVGVISGSEEQSAYTYLYDKSNKLKSATSRLGDGANWSGEENVINESMTYDQNGSITSLNRNQPQYEIVDLQGSGGFETSYISSSIDALAYAYQASMGDQLARVTDAITGDAGAPGFDDGSSGTGDDYTYDSNGNLTSDANRGIQSITYNLLGKVKTILFDDGRLITYTYDASGSKLTMEVCKDAECLITDYVDTFVYENDVLKFFGSPAGRVVSSSNGLEYQYAISDNQGNTRVVFTSSMPVDDPTATFEGDANDDSDEFLFDPNFVVSFPSANHTPSGGEVVKMNQTYKVGPSKSIKVYPGDKVEMEVWEYHEGAAGFGTSSTLAGVLINMVADVFGGVNGAPGEAGAIYSGVEDAITIFGSGGNRGTDAPAAYLNYILFDEDYNVLNAGWQPAPATTFTQQRIFFEMPLHIEEEGFLFVYLSYDNDSNNWVFFDDFKVTHTKTNVIQYNEYYPYGLQTRNSWTREGSKNNFLHNGGTELNSSSGYYDLFYRNYDAAIGRFIQADPLAHMDHSVSSYAYAGNNPLMFNDPLGDVKITQATPMYNPNAGWGSFALNYAAFRSSTFIAGFSYFVDVDPAFAFLQISPEAHATLYGTATTDEIYGKRWNPHGGEQITYEEWRELGGNDPSATDKDLFFSGGWEVAQQGVAGPGIDYGNFVDPASLNLNQLGPYYQTNANYSESYWKGMPRPGYMKVSVPNIGIMVTPRDSNWDLATTKQQLAKAFDFARGSLYYAYKAGEVNSTNASASFIEFVNLGIEIHVGFGRAMPGLTLTAPVSNITFKGIWAVPSFN